MTGPFVPAVTKQVHQLSMKPLWQSANCMQERGLRVGHGCHQPCDQAVISTVDIYHHRGWESLVTLKDPENLFSVQFLHDHFILWQSRKSFWLSLMRELYIFLFCPERFSLIWNSLFSWSTSAVFLPEDDFFNLMIVAYLVMNIKWYSNLHN